jgi:hypothetical protein
LQFQLSAESYAVPVFALMEMVKNQQSCGYLTQSNNRHKLRNLSPLAPYRRNFDHIIGVNHIDYTVPLRQKSRKIIEKKRKLFDKQPFSQGCCS